MSKTRKLSGLVSDSGPLADGLLSAADIGALPLAGGTLTGTVSFASAQTFPGTQAALVSGTNIKTVNGNSVLGSGDIVIAGGVTSFNTRTGDITLGSSDVTTALGFTPYNATNPSGYITSSGSISGNAATASAVSGLTLTSSANPINPDNVVQNQIGYNNSVSLFGQNDGGLYSSAYSSIWVHQIYGDFRTGQLAVRGKSSGTWQAWRSVLDSSNVGTYAMPIAGGQMTGLLVGRPTVGTNVNTNNDTGSFSVRGNAANAASISFHRTSAYAINMGLGTDNVFVIGGWSASANAFRMDGSGNLTMLANVTAYSDERVKTNWRKLSSDFIERLAEVKHGIYDRTDQTSTRVGVSAQSLQKILEHAVMEDKEGKLSVAYGNAALVAAVELAKRVISQQARIEKLETLVHKLLETK